jgi:hypothetical protein
MLVVVLVRPPLSTNPAIQQRPFKSSTILRSQVVLAFAKSNFPFSVWRNFSILVSLQNTTEFLDRLRNRPLQFFSRCCESQWFHRGKQLYTFKQRVGCPTTSAGDSRKGLPRRKIWFNTSSNTSRIASSVSLRVNRYPDSRSKPI